MHSESEPPVERQGTSVPSFGEDSRSPGGGGFLNAPGLADNTESSGVGTWQSAVYDRRGSNISEVGTQNHNNGSSTTGTAPTTETPGLVFEPMAISPVVTPTHQSPSDDTKVLTTEVSASADEGTGNPLHRDLSGLNHRVPDTMPTREADVKAKDPVDETPTPRPKPAAKISWKKGRLIGSGAFGKVFLGMDQQTGSLIAAKEFSFDPDDAVLGQRIAKLQREIQIMKNLEHENVVSYLGADRVDTNFYVFMEYVPGGSVQGLLQDCGPLQEQVASLYTAQMLTGIGFLHASNVVHRDVKSANVLVTVEGVIKLADFGSAQQKIAGDKIMSMEGTTSWMAPEVVREEPASYSSDVWSLGCTLMEMLTGKAPWAHIGSPMAVMMQIGATGKQGSPLPPLPPDLNVSLECINFLRLCLEPDQNRRPTAVSLLSHPFVLRHLEAAQTNNPNFEADFYQASFSQQSFVRPDPEGSVSRSVNARRESASSKSINRSAMFGIAAQSFGVETEPSMDDINVRAERASVVTEHLSQLSLRTASDIARTVSSLSSHSLRSYMSERQQQSILQQVFRGGGGSKGSPSSRHTFRSSGSPSSASGGAIIMAVPSTSFGSSQNTQRTNSLVTNSLSLPSSGNYVRDGSVNAHQTVDSLAAVQRARGSPPSSHGSTERPLNIFQPPKTDLTAPYDSSENSSTVLAFSGTPALAATLKPPSPNHQVTNISEEGFSGKVTTERIRAEMLNQLRNGTSSGTSGGSSSHSGSRASSVFGGWMNVVLDHPEMEGGGDPQDAEGVDIEFTPRERAHSSRTSLHVDEGAATDAGASGRNAQKSDDSSSNTRSSVTTKILVVVVTTLALFCIALLVAVIVTNVKE